MEMGRRFHLRLSLDAPNKFVGLSPEGVFGGRNARLIAGRTIGYVHGTVIPCSPGHNKTVSRWVSRERAALTCGPGSFVTVVYRE